MKLKYAIDKENRLKINSPKSKIPLKPKGTFRINKNNQLEYWLNEPKAWRQLYNLPQKTTFEGNWQLNNNHDLELVLNKSKGQFKSTRLTLRGKIISVDNNILALEIISRDVSPRKTSLTVLKLSGVWKADEYNRIIFQVSKKNSPDTLTFKAAWRLNNNQQIEYTYEKANLITKSKDKQTLNFEGFWKISSIHKLTYILGSSFDSEFDFKVHLENPNIYPQSRVIKYRIGIGLRQPKAESYKILSLYGEWKFSRDLCLSFIMDYGDNLVRKLEFGAEISFGPDKFILSLKDGRGESLGITLTYSHKLLSSLQPQVFVRLKSCQKNQGIEAGVTIPF
jgi:hypothetical protein